MVEKIFLLGRPGGGKSTIAQLLEPIAEENGWSTRHFYDYKYLHDLFLQEIRDHVPDGDRFFQQRGPETCQGFDVREGKFVVLDTVLKQMADEVREVERNHPDEKMLLLIEFARKEYIRALDIFGYELLQGAHLLYVKLELHDCIERVQKRADIYRRRSEYDHYVSRDIMTGYYSSDDWSDDQFSKYLYHLHTLDVTYGGLDNSGDIQELESQIMELFNRLASPHHAVAEELLITR